jgi:hypothetical protein
MEVNEFDGKEAAAAERLLEYFSSFVAGIQFHSIKATVQLLTTLPELASVGILSRPY